MSDQSPALSTSKTDITVSTLKGAVGAVPFAGALLAEIVGNVIPNQRIDRIARFAELLDERVGKLEQEAIQARLKEPAAVDLVEDALVQASRATTEDRLEHIADVLANGLSQDELNEAEAKRMLWLLGQLNDAEIILLRGSLVRTRDDVQRDAAYREKHSAILAPDGTHMGSSEDEFEQEVLKVSYRQHLYDLGLIKKNFRKPRKGELPEFDDKTGMMKASGADVTRLGRMLLRYLDLIPDWYQ